MPRRHPQQGPTVKELLSKRLQVERLEDRLQMAADLAIDAPGLFDDDLDISPVPEFTGTTGGGGGTIAGAPGVIPALSSLPGAAATIFLDFDGNVEAHWGSNSNVVTPAFDRDGNVSSFSAAEISAITEIWARVAEDYAPFNINVTTVAPSSIADRVSVRIAIGGDWSDWFGQQAGGVAYVGGFTNSASNVGYVFEEALGNGDPRYTAEAASHEAGHLFGLLHQATWSGSTLTHEYNPGDSNWAPIMGVGYYSARTTWHNGVTSNSPTNTQDDMAILSGSANGFGYRADDYGSTTTAFTPLTVTGTSVNIAGLIGRNGDQDVFRFSTSGGSVSFTLNVAQYGANLDGALDILNSQGQTVATASPSNSFGASLTQSLGAGTYFVAVRSSGGYGNVGQYTLTGTVPGATQPAQISVAVSGTSIADGGSLAFGSTLVGTPITRTITVTNTGAGTLTLNSLGTLPAGYTLVSNLGSTSLAAGQSTTFTIKLNATAAGSFTGSVALGNSTTDGSFGIVLTGTVTTPTPVSVIKIIDNGDTGFGVAGSWSRLTGSGRDGDIHAAAKGTGTAVATWTFSGLTAGTYKVSVTWPANSTNASNAPFTVYDGTTLKGTYRVSEKVAPSGLVVSSSTWKNLGNIVISGNRLVVKLTNGADGRVVADAVRIEKIATTGSGAIAASSVAGGSSGGFVAVVTSQGGTDNAQRQSPDAAPEHGGSLALGAPGTGLGSAVWQHDALLSRPGDLELELAALREVRGLLDDLAASGLGSDNLASAIDLLLAEQC